MVLIASARGPTALGRPDQALDKSVRIRGTVSLLLSRFWGEGGNRGGECVVAR